MSRNRLHVVRTDVLLWALGGFEESQEAPFPGAIPYEARQAILAASRQPKVPYGYRKTLSERYGVPEGSIGVFLARCRNGTIAKYWLAA